MRQHRQRGIGLEEHLAAMDDGIGVGIIGVDAEGFGEPRSVIRLDRREAEAF